MTQLSGPQVAALVKQAGFPEKDQATMVAIAKAESGWRSDAVNTANSNGSTDRGLFQINSIHGYDPQKLMDPPFNTSAAKKIYDGQGLQAWSTYNAGRHQPYMGEARQAVANAGNVSGALPSAGGGGGDGKDSTPAAPAITYGPNGPEFTRGGPAHVLQASASRPGPLGAVRIMGTDAPFDATTQIVGSPKFECGFTVIPNLTFTIIDPFGTTSQTRPKTFAKGVRVAYLDADMRIDTLAFAPGSSGVGEVTINAIDSIVYALQRLGGARTEANMSATEFIYGELKAAGLNPDACFLGEAVPTQSAIARDVPAAPAADTAAAAPTGLVEPDQKGIDASIARMKAEYGSSTGATEKENSWTTCLRLAKELGRRVFISGNKLVFGSARFAEQWTSPGPIRQGYRGVPAHERFLVLPEVKLSTIGLREDVAELTGKVPYNRGVLFSPGNAVDVVGVPSPYFDLVAPRRMIVEKRSNTLGLDTDGVDITLIDPVDPPIAPVTSSASDKNKGDTAADGGSSQNGTMQGKTATAFVNLALAQAGKKYVYGAATQKDNGSPGAFDCSSLVQWCLARLGIDFPRVDSAQYDASKKIPVDQAIKTRGALLNIYGQHIAISLGNGKTIEAANENDGVGSFNANGRGWTGGGLIPQLTYP